MNAAIELFAIFLAKTVIVNASHKPKDKLKYNTLAIIFQIL